MFDLLRKFILMLKKILHIRPELTKENSREVQQREEKPALLEEKPTEIKPLEKKIPQTPPEKKNEVAPIPEETPPEIPSEKELVEAKLPEKKTPQVLTRQEKPSESLPKSSKEKIPTSNSEQVDKTKTGKPYKKKAPTEESEKEHGKPSEEEKRTLSKPQSEIDLGERRKARKTTPQRQPPEVPERHKREGKEPTTRVESPYVEIDLDETKVFFIIPKQGFKANAVNNIPKPLHYKLELNGKEQTVSARVSSNKQDILAVEELRIELEQPLKNFKVVYPDELKGKIYSYKHSNEILYPFIAIGNNRCRMHYLYDNHGNPNPLPKRDIWILLENNFDLFSEQDVVEERWIWEKYQAKCINLTNINELIIKNRQTGEELMKVPCEPSFSLEGEEVVEDDFKRQRKVPLFAGNSIKIKAPRVNSSGWVIWVQNKQAGHKVITDNWTGEEPLEVKLPNDLPCECGEFQVDICEQGDRIPIETLFFRYIPHLQLEFPRSLIIPDPCIGHKKEIIKILLKRDFQNWELKQVKDVDCMHLKNGYQLELLPEKDTIRFSLMKKGKPETEAGIRITIPRLKWRISEKDTWNYKPLQIKRDELITGTDYYLTVCTNDFDTKYDLSAILETNGQRLQEAKFIRKGMVHNLLLNQFYDTIKKNEDKITLRVEIRKADDDKVLGIPEILHFEEVIQKPLLSKSISYDLINILSFPKICSILREIKIVYPKERSVCKDILQIYYQKIRGGKSAKRDISMDKKDFVIRALAFIKVIMDTYGKKVPIKKQKKWRKKIDFLQKKYLEEFSNVYNIFSRS